MKIRQVTKTIINEIDHNKRSVIQAAMKAKIQCGFEVEFIWPHDSGVDEFFDVKQHNQRIDQHEYEDIAQYLSDNDITKLDRHYETFIRNHPDFSDLMAKVVSDEIETDTYLYNFSIQLAYIEREVGIDRATDIVRKRFGIEPETKEEVVDKIFDLPGVEDALKSELISLHIDEITTMHLETVYDDLRATYGYDDWVREYGSLSKLLNHFGIEVVFGDDEMRRLIEYVSTKVQSWVDTGSKYTDVVFGDTHENATSASHRQSFWRVEPDSSITDTSRKTLNIPAEVVSPVYDTMSEMLTELESLLSFLDTNGIITNESTGLHVTMSYAEERSDLNRLKALALTDDNFLLSKFDREMNGYTLSQKNLLIKELNREYGAMIDDDLSSSSGLKTLERVLSDGFISSDKYRSMHFKGSKNDVGNELVEYRVIGNTDYHKRFNDIKDAVLRYATGLIAAHDTSLYKRDYLKKLSRIIQHVTSYDVNVRGSDPEQGEVGMQLLIKTMSGNFPELRMIYDQISRDIERYGVDSYYRSLPEYFRNILEEVYEREIDLKIKHRKAALKAIEEAGTSVASVLDSLKVSLLYQADSLPKSQVRKIMGTYKLAKLLLTGRVI